MTSQNQKQSWDVKSERRSGPPPKSTRQLPYLVYRNCHLSFLTGDIEVQAERERRWLLPTPKNCTTFVELTRIMIGIMIQSIEFTPRKCAVV